MRSPWLFVDASNTNSRVHMLQQLLFWHRFVPFWHRFAVVNDGFANVSESENPDLGLCCQNRSTRQKKSPTTVHNRKSLPFFREKGQGRRTALESAHRAIAPSRHRAIVPSCHRAIVPSCLAFFCSFRDSVATHCSHASGLGIIAYGNSKYRKGCGACEALRPWYEWRASVKRRNRCGLRVDAKGRRGQLVGASPGRIPNERP